MLTFHRCAGCASSFALVERGAKRRKTGPRRAGDLPLLRLSCPVCHGKKVSDVDVVKDVGGGLARKAFNHLLTKLPSGD